MVLLFFTILYLKLNFSQKYKKILYYKFFNIRFHRGQPVYVEGKDLNRFAAHISAIGTEAVSIRDILYKSHIIARCYFFQIWVKKVSDSSKVRIYISQLSRGKISIKRRAS